MDEKLDLSFLIDDSVVSTRRFASLNDEYHYIKNRLYEVCDRIRPGTSDKLKIGTGRDARILVCRMTETIIPNGPLMETMWVMLRAAEKKLADTQRSHDDRET